MLPGSLFHHFDIAPTPFGYKENPVGGLRYVSEY